MPDKLLVLKEIAEFLNEETDKYEMMDGVLKRLIERTQFETAWIIFIDNEGKHELISHYHLPEGLENNNFQFLKNDSCWCVQKFTNNELVKATNIIACSRLDKANKKMPVPPLITHHATVPLMSGTQRYGLLNIATSGKEVYSTDELNLLESVAFQIGSTLKRIELNDREKETLLIKERHRLARELHDSVNQMLFSISITSNAAKNIDEKMRTLEAFNHIESVSRHAMKEMKALIWQLKPIGLENGIIYAVEQYAKLLELTVEVSIDGFYTVSDEVESNIYRVIQEALNNVRKHANTNYVEIMITINENQLSVTISDDGDGFDIDAVNTDSQGLKNMRERVSKLGGKISIETSKNNGTEILFTVPR